MNSDVKKSIKPDLADCADNLGENLSHNRDEAKARIRLVKLCQRIVDSAAMDVYLDEFAEAKGE